MFRRAIGTFGLVLLLITAVVHPASAEGLVRTIGVRVILPWTGAPFLVGLEATTSFGFGIGSASFFLTASGKTLVTVSADVRLTEETEDGAMYLRLTTGFFYFDPSAFLPTLLLGAGLFYQLSFFDPVALGFAGEFIYPLTFPLPMFSISGGWSLQ